MDPVAAAVTRFRSALRTYLASDVPALRIKTDVANLNTLLPVIRAEEWTPTNRSPFVVVATPYEGNKPPFGEMCALIVRYYETLRQDGDLGSLPEFGQAADGAPTLMGLEQRLRRFMECTGHRLTPPLLGWLPASIGDVDGYRLVVESMLGLTGRTAVRVMVLDAPNEEWLGRLAEVSESRMRTTVFEYDEKSTREYFQKLMLVPPSLGRARGSPPGAAAPDVIPPRRPGPPLPTEEEVKAAMQRSGAAPVLMPSEGEELRRLIFGAAAALGEGRESDAIQQQRAAVELCRAANVKLEQAMMALVLAIYLAQAKRGPEAEASYRDAARLGEEAKGWPQVAQAKMGLGYLLVMQRKLPDAALTYEEAAVAAAQGGAALLELEMQRMAGRCHMDLGREDDAIRCWTSGVARASTTPIGELRTSSFSEMVASLRAALRRRRLAAEEANLDAVVGPIEQAL